MSDPMEETIIGYKVMKLDNGEIISGANSQYAFNLEIGSTIAMQGNGIYIGTDKEYVMTYYSGLADIESLLTLEFKKSDIVTGSLDDREVEISVKQAKIIDTQMIIEGELIQKKNPVKGHLSKPKIT